MKKAFIIGQPISHSLSPKLHGFWLKQYGIDGEYEALEVPPEYLVKTLRKLPEKGYLGGNITIPHKEKAVLICDEADDLAKKVGAVNTVLYENGKIKGYNTDVFGFSRSISGTKPKNALIIGAGGASRAIIVALQELGAEVTICNRTDDKAKKLAAEFGAHFKSWKERQDIANFDMVINATSLGLKNEGELDIDLSALPKTATVVDIVYNPIKTKFLAKAESLGLKTIDGLWMLLYQAAPGFEKWFGKKPEVTSDLRGHLIKCL